MGTSTPVYGVEGGGEGVPVQDNFAIGGKASVEPEGLLLPFGFPVSGEHGGYTEVPAFALCSFERSLSGFTGFSLRQDAEVDKGAEVADVFVAGGLGGLTFPKKGGGTFGGAGGAEVGDLAGVGILEPDDPFQAGLAAAGTGVFVVIHSEEAEAGGGVDVIDHAHSIYP